MGKITSFEDLKVWQKARRLTKLIYSITKKFPKEETYGIISQLRRAAVSMVANIAEGFSRYHTAETMQFYRNARGSTSEVKALLYVSLDFGYIKKKDFDKLIEILDEVGKMLNGLIKSTKNFRKGETNL